MIRQQREQRLNLRLSKILLLLSDFGRSDGELSLSISLSDDDSFIDDDVVGDNDDDDDDDGSFCSMIPSGLETSMLLYLMISLMMLM